MNTKNLYEEAKEEKAFNLALPIPFMVELRKEVGSHC